MPHLHVPELRPRPALVYLCRPETTNLTLEDIDWLFLEEGAVEMSKRVASHGWGDDNPWQRRVDRMATQVRGGELKVNNVEGRAATNGQS